jgi:hypothetical protein
MALTYDTLRTTVGDYLDRSDLDSVIPTFVQLAEAKLRRRLRHWKMEKRATADTVVGQRTLELPSDFLEMRNIKLNTDPVTVLEYLPPAIMNWSSSGTGTPGYYTIIGSELHFESTPAEIFEVEMYYYAFEELDESNTTNWVLTDHPDIYVYGTLLEAESFLMNDPRLQIWKMGFEEGLTSLNKSGDKASHSGAPLVMRAM